MDDTSISIIIKGTTNLEKTATTSIPYVNPEATNQAIYALGAKFFSFTTLTDPIIIKQTQQILTAGGE